MFTVGILNPSTSLADAVTAFKGRMTELGYTEGQDVQYLYDNPAVDKAYNIDTAAKALVALNVDLIASIGSPATSELQTLKTDKQVIFLNIFDPVGAGYIPNMSQPGGNMTGIRSGAAEAKRLEWFLRLVPHMKRLWVPYTVSGDLSSQLARQIDIAVAPKLGIELVMQPCSSASDFVQASLNIPAGIDGIYLLPDTKVVTQIGNFVKTSLLRNLPISSPLRGNVTSGALMSYGFDFTASAIQAARIADQILKGVKPGSLPTETAEFFLSINIAVADKLGIPIRDGVLNQADNIDRALPASWHDDF